MDAVRSAVEVEGGVGHVAAPAATTAMVELHWIPLGAGQHVVRLSGRVFERVSALVHRRRPLALHHSALTVDTNEGRYVIEMTPVIAGDREGRGVVAEGAVGMRWLGRVRLFRYEIRCWRNGVIPDLPAATASEPVHLDDIGARRLLELVAHVPTPVWGRDELRAGEMWNSNSVIAWTLARARADMTALGPPPGTRAPGWDAGLRVAARPAPRSGSRPEITA